MLIARVTRDSPAELITLKTGTNVVDQAAIHERSTVKISSAFASSLDAPAHIVTAERLGYERAWLYDTPHQSPDVWMLLALAAERTERIGLGPGVLVPILRHPMVNAAGAAGLAALAPGRVAVAFGTGFTSARAMGTKPATWAFLREYIAAFRGLLAGKTVEWQGARLRICLIRKLRGGKTAVHCSCAHSHDDAGGPRARPRAVAPAAPFRSLRSVVQPLISAFRRSPGVCAPLWGCVPREIAAAGPPPAV
ncbi:LLM class flavin-dependent oxidoreductase [Streptomyces sp. CA-106131]